MPIPANDRLTGCAIQVTCGANVAIAIPSPRMAEPTVCVKALRPPFFTAAAKTGLSIPELVKRFDLAPDVLTDLGARVPHATVVRVWDGLAEQCDDAGFGIEAATLLGAPQIDLLDHVLQRSPSMRALGASFVRYQRLFHDANDVQFRDTAEGVLASHQLRGDLPRSRHFIEFILAMWVARLRSVLGADRVVIERACFRHAAVIEPARYHALFGRNLEFEASLDALVLPRTLLDEPLPAGDPTAATAFEGHLDHELGKLSSASSPDAVRAQIVRLMRAGSEDAFDLAQIARRLAVSRRTLQRRLLEEGTTFRDLIDAARRDVALAELARGTSTVTDLAFLLGFSEHTAFSRAFRRWTGKSPVVYLRAASSAMK